MGKLAEWLERAKRASSKDEFVEAVGQLCSIMHPRLYAFVRTMIRDDGAYSAEDLVQETLMNIATSFYSFLGNSVSEFESWCFRICRRRIADRRRKLTREVIRADMVDEYLDSVATKNNASANPLLEQVLELLSECSERCRLLIVMHKMEGRPYTEIAKILGISPDAVRMRTNRCFKSFVERVESEIDLS